MTARAEVFARASDARCSAQRGRFAATFALAVALLFAGCDSSPEARERYVRENRAYAEFLVAQTPSYLVFPPANLRENEFEVYRTTQSKLIKSPFVLNAALRDPDLAELEILRGTDDPIAFLEEKLEVDLVAHEFVRVSFAGAPSQEAAAIVNAVADAYLQEVANAEAMLRQSRSRDLEVVHQELSEMLRQKVRAYKRLQSVQTEGAGLAERRKMMGDLTARIRAGLIQARLDLLRDRAQLAVLETAERPLSPENGVQASPPTCDPASACESDPVAGAYIARKAVLVEMLKQAGSAGSAEGHDDGPLKRELAAVEMLLAARREDLRGRSAQPPVLAERLPGSPIARLTAAIAANERLIPELEHELVISDAAGPAQPQWAVEIERLRDDIDQIGAIDRKVASQITRLRLEDGAPPRVTLFRKAQAHAD